MLVKNPVFLYFAVDDPFNSEMNATPAVISRCPFHIRVQTRMRPCEAKAPKVVKCADCVTNSFASHLCFWLVAELLLWKQKKKGSCSCFMHGKYFVLDLWPTAKPTVFAICTSPIIQLFCSPKLCRTFDLFLLAITVVPREIKDNAYAHFWGENRVYYG